MPSKLDRPIAAEIRDDRMAAAIHRIAALPEVRTILEVGSSSGDGSTDAFVSGALANPAGAPTLHCIELSRARFERLVVRHGARDFVHCHCVSSVRLERFMTRADIARFRGGFRPWLRRRGEKIYLQWLEENSSYVTANGLSRDGIREIAERHGIDRFDAVLIDGSEFTGPAILEDVYGARYVILDDIRALKNYDNYRFLRRDPAYEMVDRSWMLRNGYAVFRRLAS